MLSALVAAYVCFAPAAGAPTPAPSPTASPGTADPSAVPAGRSRLIVHGLAEGTVTVRDANGRVAASVMVSGGQDLPIDLAPGRYSVTDDSGTTCSIELAAGASAEVTIAGAAPVAPTPTVSPTPAPAAVAEGPVAPPSPAMATKGEGKGKGKGKGKRRPRQGSTWKRIVAPLMSASVPGSGQILNGQPGKGVGMFLGTVSLGAGALALALTRDPLSNSSPNLDGSTFGTEIVSGVGFGLLTGSLAMLYAAQIMDAYAVAAHMDRPRPATRHRFSLQLTRMATVGLRAGDPAAAYYPEWGVTFLAQVYRRLSVGLSDMTLKYGVGRTSAQAGVRLSYRFYDRGRLWLGGSAGLIVQGTTSRTPRPLGDSVSAADRTSAFAAIPYAQLDLRLFFLHHWSLDLTPRLSAPFGTRFYRGDRALPSHAATFELGTGVGVVF